MVETQEGRGENEEGDGEKDRGGVGPARTTHGDRGEDGAGISGRQRGRGHSIEAVEEVDC
jgi:hypothetical protein